MYYYKFFKVVYEKTTYKDMIFVNKNLLINIKLYLFFINLKICQIQTGSLSKIFSYEEKNSS
jgi:hypothetical protein